MLIQILPAVIEDRPLIERMMELYSYDFSAYDGAELNSHGLYGYPYLDHYWVEETRHPFLLRVDGKLAGFALVRQTSDEDGTLRAHMAEFFVLRKYRRQGVGKNAACQVFNRFPGRWEVSEIEANRPAQAFWRAVIADYAFGQFRERQADFGPVQEFETPPERLALLDPTRRFSSRVEQYRRYRPSYPAEVFALLELECGLTPDWEVGDIGAGTGIFTRQILDYGCRVVAVEPNAEMRQAAAESLGQQPRLRLLAAPAESVPLPDASLDLICAAQAFHWFEPQKARREFARLLRPGGWVALLWNNRRPGEAFSDAYEELLGSYSLDYKTIQQKHADDPNVESFFSPAPVRAFDLPNPRRLNWETLEGGALSASYVPQPGHPNHTPFFNALRALFDLHQQEGTVALDMETRVYLGRLG